MAVFYGATGPIDMSRFPSAAASPSITTFYASDTGTGFLVNSDLITLYGIGSDISYEYAPTGIKISGSLFKETLRVGESKFDYGEPVYILTNLNYDLGGELQTIGAVLPDGSPPLVNPLKLAGDDFIVGSEFNDILLGYDGNDTFSPLAGNDTIFGGAGADTIKVSGLRSSYAITVNTVVGPNLSYTYDSIERFGFSDKYLAFDLEKGESAGYAVRLIAAVAGEAKLANRELVGWTIFDLDGGTVHDLVQAVVNNGQVAQEAGGSSDGALVSLLYRNATRTEISEAELTAYLDFMHGNNMTQAEAIEFVAFKDSFANQIDMVGLMQTGIEFEPVTFAVPA